nr:MAG TPA: hypothetical protein [Caudoviricetes sp.]
MPGSVLKNASAVVRIVVTAPATTAAWSLVQIPKATSTAESDGPSAYDTLRRAAYWRRDRLRIINLLTQLIYSILQLLPRRTQSRNLSLIQRGRDILDTALDLAFLDGVDAVDEAVQLVVPAARALSVEEVLVTMNVEAAAVVGFDIGDDLGDGFKILRAHLGTTLDADAALVCRPIACMPGDVLNFDELGAAACLHYIVGGGAGAAGEELTDLLETLAIIAPVMDDDGIDVVDGAVCLGERSGVVFGDVGVLHNVSLNNGGGVDFQPRSHAHVGGTVRGGMSTVMFEMPLMSCAPLLDGESAAPVGLFAWSCAVSFDVHSSRLTHSSTSPGRGGGGGGAPAAIWALSLLICEIAMLMTQRALSAVAWASCSRRRTSASNARRALVSSLRCFSRPLMRRSRASISTLFDSCFVCCRPFMNAKMAGMRGPMITPPSVHTSGGRKLRFIYTSMRADLSSTTGIAFLR